MRESGFLLCVLQRVVVPVCVVLCVSWICGCRSPWNGCMNVAWVLFWGGSRSTKLVFFRVKWLRPAMKGTSCVRWLRLGSFWFLPCVRQRVVVPVCVVLCVSWISGCRSHWNGCMIVVIWCCHVLRYVQVCKTQCNGCVKVAWRRGCMRNTIVFCSWTP